MTGGSSTSTLFPAADLVIAAFSPRAGVALPAPIGLTAGQPAGGGAGKLTSPAVLVEAFGQQLLEVLLSQGQETAWAPGATAVAPALPDQARPQEAEGTGLVRSCDAPMPAGPVLDMPLLPLAAPVSAPARTAPRARIIGNAAVDAAIVSAMDSGEGLAARAPAEADPLIAALPVREAKRAGAGDSLDHELPKSGFSRLRSPFGAGELLAAPYERGIFESLRSAAVETRILLPPAGGISQRVLDGRTPVAEFGVETSIAEPDNAPEQASALGPESLPPPRWTDPSLDIVCSAESVITSAEQPRATDQAVPPGAPTGIAAPESTSQEKVTRRGEEISAAPSPSSRPTAAGGANQRRNYPVFVARITDRPGFSEPRAPAEPHASTEPRAEATASRTSASRPAEPHQPAPPAAALAPASPTPAPEEATGTVAARKPAVTLKPAGLGKNDAVRDPAEPRREDAVELPTNGRHMADDGRRPARLDRSAAARRWEPASDTAHPVIPGRGAIVRPDGGFTPVTAGPATRIAAGGPATESGAAAAARATERVVGLAKPAPREAPRDVSLRLTAGSEESVAIRLEERAGELRVSVRTRDQGLAESLREGVPELVSRLDQRGYDAEIWRPGGTVSGQRPEVRGLESSHASAGRDFGGSGGSGGSAEHDRGRGRQGEADGQWSEELETLFSGVGKKEKESHDRKR